MTDLSTLIRRHCTHPIVFATAVAFATVPIAAKAQMSSSDYAAKISAVADSIVAGATAGSGDVPAMFFDLNDGSAGGGDAVVTGARRLYDLYRAVGGPRLDQHAYYERKDGRIYIGLDGDGGRWVSGAVEALETFREELVEKAVAQQPDTPATQAKCQGFACLLNANYQGEAPLAGFLPRGGSQVLTLSATGFKNAGGPPAVLVPAGLFVEAVTYLDSETIEVALSADENATLGAQMLHVFNEGQAFRSVGRYLVQIVASPEELEAIAGGGQAPEVRASAPMTDLYLGGTGQADDHGNDAASAADITDNADGRLEQPGDRDVFRIVVEQNATVDIASAGPADVRAELRAADETLVAEDDDGGVWYNFRIVRPLAAGTYFLSVKHCCGGTGRYRISAKQSPK